MMNKYRFSRLVAAALPSPVPVHLPVPLGPPSVQRVSIERACAELGYEPRHHFGELAPLIVDRIAALVGLRRESSPLTTDSGGQT